MTKRIGKYVLERELARGGMGAVFVARDPQLDRQVALKLLLPQHVRNDEIVQRLIIEAEALAALQHPNVVTVHEIGRDPEGVFVALELVEGGTLSGLIKDRGALPDREAAELIAAVADAIQVAHEQGIIHRDLKPANILLSSLGIPKVTDFGLAKLLDGMSLTETGDLMGSPPYMPPEQADGRKVDHLADIYSLGATLYHCITGRAPFKGPTMQVVLKVMTKEPPRPRKLVPGIDPRLEWVCLQCMRKEREERYASAGEVADDLYAFLRGEDPRVAPPTRLGTLAPIAVGLVGLLALAAGLAVWVWESYSEPQQAVAEVADAPEARTVAPVDSRAAWVESLHLDEPTGVERLEHLEVYQPWAIARTPRGLLLRAHGALSPALAVPVNYRRGGFRIDARLRVRTLERGNRVTIALHHTRQAVFVAAELRGAGHPHASQLTLGAKPSQESEVLPRPHPNQTLLLRLDYTARPPHLVVSLRGHGEVRSLTQPIQRLPGGRYRLRIGANVGYQRAHQRYNQVWGPRKGHPQRRLHVEVVDLRVSTEPGGDGPSEVRPVGLTKREKIGRVGAALLSSDPARWKRGADRAAALGQVRTGDVDADDIGLARYVRALLHVQAGDTDAALRELARLMNMADLLTMTKVDWFKERWSHDVIAYDEATLAVIAQAWRARRKFKSLPTPRPIPLAPLEAMLDRRKGYDRLTRSVVANLVGRASPDPRRWARISWLERAAAGFSAAPPPASVAREAALTAWRAGRFKLAHQFWEAVPPPDRDPLHDAFMRRARALAAR